MRSLLRLAHEKWSEEARMRRELLGFGVGGEGQLGVRPPSYNDSGNFHTPEHIFGVPCSESGVTVSAIACGEKHTVFLADDGRIWTVGGNEMGQLGRGNVSPGSFSIFPVVISNSVRIIQISAGRNHSCAVSDDGRLFAWGDNSSGQLALPPNLPVQSSPKRIAQLNEVVQVSCGSESTIALLDNSRVFVWGLQYDGAVFHEPREVPLLIGVPIVTVSGGGRHWMALSASGAVFAWGQNEFGQLGTGDDKYHEKPILLEGVSDMKVVDIACGDAHSLLLTRDGRVFVCGADSFGQLGIGRRLEKTTVPRVVQDLMGSHVTRVAAGRAHSIAIVGGSNSSSKVYTFGLNSSGQLGQGNYRNLITPRPIDTLDCSRAVFAGWDQTFVLRASGVSDVSSGANVDLKLPQFLSWISKKELLKDKLELIGKLESVFTSLSCLNGSFLYNDERRFSCTDTNHGVDLDSAMEFFNTLSLSGDFKQYDDLMMDSLEMSLFAEDTKPSDLINKECLRLFLFLPWIHLFVQPTTSKEINSLHRRFCTYLSQLRKQHFKTLVEWWMRLPARHFNRVVSGLVAALNIAIDDEKRPTSIFVPLLEILKVLAVLNEKKQIIPVELFYVKNLADKFDLKMDYLQWAMRDQNGRENHFFWASFPFIMNGVAKGELLFVEAQLQQHITMLKTNPSFNIFGMNFVMGDPHFSIEVRRDNIIMDTINALTSAPPEFLRKSLKVKFRGEDAEDHGGVRKEFFMILFEKLLLPEYGMFVENEETHLVWFSGVEGELNAFELVGKLAGLAVYNSVLVAFPFPLALYKVLLNKELTLEDLIKLSPTEGRSLQSLLDFDGPDVEEVFMLNFTITHSLFGSAQTVELKPEGEKQPVTSTNKSEYVRLYVEARLKNGFNGEISRQLSAFCNGFREIVHSRVISLFQPIELMELVVGNEHYDWDKFKQRMHYKDVYHAKHPAILAFWDAFFELTLDERKQFLQFLSGTTRLPVRGMDAFNAMIQPCAPHLLPAAHTCFNLLDLPNISDKAELLRRLRISIKNARGFSLV